MFAPEFSMLITSASAMLALVGASGIGYAAGKRRTVSGAADSRARKGSPDPGAVLVGATDPRPAKTPGDRSAVLAGAADSRPAKAQTDPGAAPPTTTTSVLQSPPEIAPSPPQARWALKPVHYVSDDQNVAMFARFLREIAAGTHALCADDVHVNVPGGLVPLLDDASLAADWLLLDELHEFYRGWCRLEGVMPITRAVLQEKIEAAGAVKKRHWAEGGTCERLRARVPPSRLPQRPTLVRVLSLREMERRERSRHAGAGRTTSDQDVMYTRAA